MRQDMREHKTKSQVKKNYEIIPIPYCPHPHPGMNQPPPLPHLCHPPIIHSNNTMTIDTEFLVQTRQSNKCGSAKNDEIFNLHLGSE